MRYSSSARALYFRIFSPSFLITFLSPEIAASIMIIIIIIIIIHVNAFKKGIYIYILQTNHVSKVYSVAALLCLKFVLHVI